MIDTSQSYKLLVSDVDGTLMGADHVISPKVKAAIKRWIDSGRHFTVASGRQYLMINKDTKELGLKTPLIVRGGAEIVDPVTGKFLLTESIDKKEVKEFVDILLKHKLGVMVEVDNYFYENIVYGADEYPDIIERPLGELPYSDSQMIIIRVPNENQKEIELLMENEIAPKFPNLHFVRSYNMRHLSYDVTSLKATKHLAVLELIKHLGLKREETVGIGDGYNDFPLLEACGLKVAMGNARDELKAIADIVVPSYEEDGVAYLIDKLLE